VADDETPNMIKAPGQTNHDPLMATPLVKKLSHRVAIKILATRPAFLSVTAFAVALGWLSALTTAPGLYFQYVPALLTLIFALTAHAGANVLNDFYDAHNGTDNVNSDRIYPFTGGAQLIQTGKMTLAETKRWGWQLLAAVVLAGFVLTWQSHWGLIAIGAVGLIFAWAYSAPPLFLVGRGWGEFTITASWLLIIIGSDFVQRQGFSWSPFHLGFSYAVMVAGILYMNQFPDSAADARAGKRTMVVRLGANRACWGFMLILTIAHGWIIALVVTHIITPWALLALSALLPSSKAMLQLWQHASSPSALRPAIIHTLVAAHWHGAMLILALIIHYFTGSA
jgi:1,4-dihydroxy-2-naphthoate octaprenyltransferase